MHVLPEYYDFQVRSRIVAGPGTASSFGNELERFKAERAFIVTDEVVRGLGFLDRIEESLTAAGLETAGVFDEVPPNSEFGVVMRAAEACREAGGDLLVAVGGGSVLDTAKGMNIVLSLGGEIADYQGFGLINEPLGPFVAVPTTAGTGSEVTGYSVIREEATESKQTLVSPYLASDLAVLDPELTLSMPPGLTASTGLDALSHAVEAYLSTNWRPVSDALALHACRLIAEWLPRAVESGDDLEARYWMLTAACEAGMAFSSAMVGCVHAMAHAVGGLYEVPHGLANAVLLAPGMEYNLPAAEGRLADLARAFGLEPTGDVSGDARAAVDFVREFVARVGLPTRLREAGVPEEGLERIAEAACVDAAVYTNPREATPEELLEVLKKAY
ncbi:MAG TPA: NAD-dependent alcohol dehydrogenase [Clostridiales bacterium]|nr:NAD-dependent alcohol dehydrogenase [Clostridiales bacterium]